jgi:cbb3-type cytochrome oxidase subunit 3
MENKDLQVAKWILKYIVLPALLTVIVISFMIYKDFIFDMIDKCMLIIIVVMFMMVFAILIHMYEEERREENKNEKEINEKK